MAVARRSSAPLLTAICGFAVLAAPAIAYSLGLRATPNQNRATTDFDDLHVGWDGLSTIGDFVDDRLPLRSVATDIDSWIDRHVFDEEPAFGGSASPRVIRGDQGWLFLNDDVTAACSSLATESADLDRLVRFADTIAASGRAVTIAVAPNKSTVYADLLPAEFPGRDCLVDYSDRLWTYFSSASGDFTWVDLRTELTEARSESLESLYLPLDSHWNTLGATVASRAIVESIQPGVWDDSAIVDLGAGEYSGDLTLLLGDSTVDVTPRVGVDRPGLIGQPEEVRDSGDVNQIDRTRRYSGDGVTLIPGRTVILMDSFGVYAIDQLSPWFEEVSFFHLSIDDPELLARRVAAADRVVFLTAERLTATRFADPPRDVYIAQLGNDQVLEILRDQLANEGAP